MSDDQPMSEIRDCGSDAAAYVLGALEPAEAEAFRRHLATCVVCRDEVAAFQHVVDVMPLTAHQYAAPKALRRRVLRATRDEPRPAPGADRRRSRRGSSSLSFLPRPALALGLVVAVLVLGVAAVKLGAGGSSATQVFRASVGSAELRVTGGHGELIVRHLPAPPAGRIYEVWLQRAKRPPSPTTALFSVTASGTGDVDVPGDLHGVSQVMVTQEPAGGSRVPTTPAVIVARLT